MPEIVPVELVLRSGRWFTLYQRNWDDADDDSLAFLGDGDRVFAFPSADQLAAYVGGAPDRHRLAASPLWAEVPHRFRGSFEPQPADRHDLTTASKADRATAGATGRAAREMLGELVYFLGLDGLVQRLVSDPLGWVPRMPQVEGLPTYVAEAPRDRRDPRLIALDQVEPRVGPPPVTAAAGGSVTAAAGGSVTDAAPGSVTALEDIAPAVEALWLGLTGAGAHTLVLRDDDNEWVFLGGAGELAAARSVQALAAAMHAGEDQRLTVAPWDSLAGRDDVDYEPYEDNVVDLDELGVLIDGDLRREGAAAVLHAWPLLGALLLWTGGPDAIRPLDEDQPLGRFLVRDLIDLADGTLAAARRLAGVDLEEVRHAWDAAVATVADRVSWLD